MADKAGPHDIIYERMGEFLKSLLPVLAPFIAGAWFFYSTSNQLTVVASSQRPQNLKQETQPNPPSSVEQPWVVRGRIMNKDEPASGASVWAVATDRQGNQYASQSTATDQQGYFELLLKGVTTDPESVALSARLVGTWKTLYVDATGKTILFPGNSSLRRLVDQSVVAGIVAVLFLFTISIAILNPITFRKGYYYVSALCALLLSAGMVWYLGSGLQVIGTTEQAQVFKLGFANIYRGSYAKEIPSEWIFSLTAPVNLDTKSEAIELAARNASPGDEGKKTEGILRGLGAPLWVIFLSVIGAALLTIALVVNEIRVPPDFENDVGVRERLQKFVQHQFFILFSPLGGIFIYQALVLASAVAEPLTVAIAALGAGAALNVILERAVSASQEWFKKSQS